MLHDSLHEQLIMERTGHRSVDGVRSYKRTSDSLRQDVSDILNRTQKKKKTDNHSAPPPFESLQVDPPPPCPFPPYAAMDYYYPPYPPSFFPPPPPPPPIYSVSATATSSTETPGYMHFDSCKSVVINISSK